METYNWEEVGGGELFNFEKPGDSIEGALVAIRHGGKFDSAIYDIKTSEGKKSFFGNVVIDSRISQQMIGQTIRVVFAGEKESKTGQNYKDFKVFVAKDVGSDFPPALA